MSGSGGPEDPGGADLGQILAKAREMQGRVAQLQRDLELRRVEGSAGGGMVTVVVSGALRVLEIRIEPGLLEGGDRAMIQDLCAAAVNAALANAQRVAQEELQRLGGMGGMPGAPPDGAGGS